MINSEHSRPNSDAGELILREHSVIGAACVGLARKNIGLEKMVFDLVIIDEAGRAVAPELLIPLLRAQKAVIIGDHRQLPPVISPVLYDAEKIELENRSYCENELFSKSFFETMFSRCPQTNKLMLSTQYRMPAVIGSFISEAFYNGEIRNGSSTGNIKSLYFNKCMTLIDTAKLSGFREDDSRGSPENLREAELTVNPITDIRAKCGSTPRIAVITPYLGQKRAYHYRQFGLFCKIQERFSTRQAVLVYQKKRRNYSGRRTAETIGETLRRSE